jgi:group I intron endonuclease
MMRRAIAKYGKEQFSVVPIAFTYAQDDADNLEIFYIQQYDTIKNGYNMHQGGRGGGHTEETRRKISAARKGIKTQPTGYKHSEEVRRRMSDSHKGKQLGNTNGFKKGQTSPNRKLTDQQVIEIKNSTLDRTGLSVQYGVSKKTISQYRKVRF